MAFIVRKHRIDCSSPRASTSFAFQETEVTHPDQSYPVNEHFASRFMSAKRAVEYSLYPRGERICAHKKDRSQVRSTIQRLFVVSNERKQLKQRTKFGSLWLGRWLRCALSLTHDALPRRSAALGLAQAVGGKLRANLRLDSRKIRCFHDAKSCFGARSDHLSISR
jgi:hypothetical protein